MTTIVWLFVTQNAGKFFIYNSCLSGCFDFYMKKILEVLKRRKFSLVYILLKL